MSDETIKNYETDDVGASQSLVTLECFIGDMEGAELADDSTVDASDAVTAINGLIFSLERRDAEIARMRSALEKIERWFGEFPDTGAKWPDGSPVSYGAQCGSNGERDFMRGVAREALS